MRQLLRFSPAMGNGNNEMIRYARQPNERTFKEIGPSGKLSFLSSPIYPNQKLFPNLAEIDYQFREKDTITLYCGKTAILNIIPDWVSNQLIFSAHDTYSKQKCFPNNCSAISDTAEKVIRNYVNQVSVDKQQWAGEGIVQSAWIERYSRNFQTVDSCFIFDREGVLGFDSTEERDKFSSNCKNSLIEIMAEINIQSKDWATYNEKLPTEIDFVGASSSGDNIFIIEAKQIGSGSDKLYYSPIQVISYAIAWSKAIKCDGFIDTVNELIKAKKKASLIPDYCPAIKPNSMITPVLLLPLDSMSEEVKRRLNIVLEVCNKYRPDVVSEIVIWNCDF